MSDALDHFEALMSDVDNLIEHHPKFLEPLQGRPSADEGPLLRSCIVLIYAAWEVYFEDSLIETAKLLSERKRDDIPQKTQDYLAAKVSGDPWRLADDGWRSALVEVVRETVRGREDEQGSYGVNTASAKTVSLLQHQILGVSVLDRSTWNARGRNTAKGVKDRLTELVKLRGEIAHTGRPLTTLHLAHVRKWRNFVNRLAHTHDEKLTTWLWETSSTLIRDL